MSRSKNCLKGIDSREPTFLAILAAKTVFCVYF